MTPEPTVGTLRRDAQRAKGRRQLSLRYSERKLLLATFDLLLINLAFGVALHIRGLSDASVRGGENHLQWFLLLSAVWLGCAVVIGCYDLVRAASIPRSLGHSAVALVATWAIYLGIPYMTPTLPASRMALVMFPLLGIGGLALWRIVYATVFAHPNFQQRALIIGAGEAGRTLARSVCEMGARKGKAGEILVDEEPAPDSGATESQNRAFDAAASSIGYRVLGFIDDNIERDTTLEGARVLGTRRELPRLVQRLQVNELVVAITHLETMNAELFEAIQECREWGVSVTTMTDLYERLTGRVPIEHAGRALAVAMPVVQKPTHRFYLALQRAVDIVGALVGCVLLGGFIPIVWLANRAKSPGPLFYCQERVGKGGRPFQIVKFRSMRTDAEKFGAVWAEENDPRITPIGRILRGTRLDEVPQFWNILRGDMSLIGPRPERPHFVAQLTREIPFYRVRHAVKPGLTGWAQVRYRYGASVEDSLIKLQYDLFYIKRQSLLLDLEIVFKTIPIVLGFKGR